MSARAIAAAWLIRDLTATQRLVLLCLADAADHDGFVSAASNRYIREYCELSERAVRANLRALEHAGILTTAPASDGNGAPLPASYRLASAIATHGGVGHAVPQGHPAPHPVTRAHASAFDSTCSDPIRIDTTENKAIPRARRGRATVAIPEWIPADAWMQWDTYRCERGRKLTPSTVQRQVALLEQLRANGHDPSAVIAQSITHGWLGLFPVRNDAGLGTTTREKARMRDAYVPAEDWARYE
jgi:hypothetical protein